MPGIARALRLAAACLALIGALSPLAEAQQTTASNGSSNTNDLMTVSPLVLKQWNPMLDEMRALSPSERNLSTEGVVFPMTSAAAPNFGGFRVAPSMPVHASGDTTRQLSAVGADFNGDGCEDIASFQVSKLTVLLGDCKGGFTALTSQTTASSVYHPVAVDINHDGYPDIVAMTVPFGYLGTVVAMVNQKNGTFATPVVISKKASVYSGLMDMNVYDVNGDGNPDVVISGLGTQDSMTNSNLVFEVVFGNANGTFNTSSLIETDGTMPFKPTFAYDGGTALRMVNGQLYLYGLFIQAQRVDGVNFGSEPLYRWPVSSTGKVDTSNPLIVELPTFSSAPNKYINFADLDGDGIDDIAILNGDGELYTALGKNGGTFGSFALALPVYAGNNASTILFKDVNGDGVVDAVIAGGVFVGVWPGNGDGTFSAPSVTNLAGYALNANSGLVFPVTNHVIYDFNGDGTPDIAWFDTIQRAMNFYKGKPDGTFVGAPALANVTGGYQTNSLVTLASPDLNGDGIKDIIVNSYYGFLSGISDGKGNYTWQVLSQLTGISQMSSNTADFNKDGRDDIVFVSTDGSGTVHLWIGLSNGDGTITAKEQTMPVSSQYAPYVVIGDINGDGYPDLALALNNYIGPTYGVWPMLNDGTGKFTSGTFLNLGKTLYGSALADVNKDGKADLLVSYGAYASTTTSVYAGTSTGFASSATTIIQNTLPAASILAKDVTGDGNVDAVLSITNGASEGIMLYPGNGNGTFSSGVSLVSGLVPSYVGTTDLNGDKLPDIYFTNDETVLTDANNSRFGLVVLLGAGNNTFAAPLSYNIYGASSPVLPVDPLGTGSPNLLATAGAGATTILLNNGASVLKLAASTANLTTTDTITVAVSVAPYFSDQTTPTGYVDLFVDGTSVSRQSLAANAATVFSLSSLTAGTHVISATYEGDSNYNVNTNSGKTTLTVTKATPVFVLSADSGALSLKQGGAASTSLSLTANNAFSGPVALSCLGAPAQATCSFSQSSITLAPGQAVKVTMTLASSTVAELHPSLFSAGSSIALCGLLLMVPFARRYRRFTVLTTLALSIAAGIGLSGCSGSSSKSSISPGTYAVVVNATPGDPTVAAQSVTVSVTISK